MGQYFRIVCHECETWFAASGGMKLREIQLSKTSAMELGLWLTMHPGHDVELCGDEWFGHFHERCGKYEKQEICPEILAEAGLNPVK